MEASKYGFNDDSVSTAVHKTRNIFLKDTFRESLQFGTVITEPTNLAVTP